MITATTRARSRHARPGLPVPLRWSRRLLVLLAVVHLAVPVVMWVGRAGLATQVRAAHPEFDDAARLAAVQVALGAAVAFHLVLAGVAAALAARLPSARRPWRRLLVVSQVVATLAGAVSWSSSPMFHVVIPVVTVVEVALLVLVTVPRASAGFFARRPPAPSGG